MTLASHYEASLAHTFYHPSTTMKKDLLVRMEIPIDPPLVFSRWLPLEEEEFITVKEDNIAVKFWFDISCIPGPRSRDEISGYAVVYAEKVFADVTISDLQGQLVEHIQHGTYSRTPTPEELQLQKEFEELGRKVYEVVLGLLNRLLAYIRSLPGQFWLQEYPIRPNVMVSDFTEFNALATFDRDNWFSWIPTRNILVTLPPTYDSRYLDKNAWFRAREFVNSSNRIPLILELLAGAEFFASGDHTRSALTEAVTALEIAINDFARNFKADETFGPILARRMGTNSLKTQVKHMGLTGTINYLFPIIFTEEQIPTELLRDCQEAINERGNVVHGGQREVKDLQRFLASIRQICNFLEEFKEQKFIAFRCDYFYAVISK